ncbi:hypothetical protein Lal_00031412 [Lupinus albus]|nr:hypothetical protein Lal_00031412 [Lupinus albus]
MENKLIHYLIDYILVQRNINHAQSTMDDLKLMLNSKNVMSGIAFSSSRLLAYGIFLSCVIDHLGIDTYGMETMVIYPREDLVVDT